VFTERRSVLEELPGTVGQKDEDSERLIARDILHELFYWCIGFLFLPNGSDGHDIAYERTVVVKDSTLFHPCFNVDGSHILLTNTQTFDVSCLRDQTVPTDERSHEMNYLRSLDVHVR